MYALFQLVMNTNILLVLPLDTKDEETYNGEYFCSLQKFKDGISGPGIKLNVNEINILTSFSNLKVRKT